MKLLHATPVRLDSRTGDTEHVVHLCRELARQGIEIHMVAVGPRSHGIEEEGLTVYAIDPPRPGAVSAVRAIAAAARRLARELRPDVVYVRPFPLDWFFLLRHLAAWRIPYVYELNAITGAQFRAIGQPLKGWLYERVEGVSIRNAAAIFPVTEEIGTWATRLGGRKVPMLVAGNGVDVEAVCPGDRSQGGAVRRSLGVPDHAFVMAMAGFTRPWHGFDRALAGLAALDEGAHLWLIGSQSPGETASTLSAARELRVDDRVRVLDRLGPRSLADALAAADIGIGPLGLDRNGLREAQPIKVRHYLAAGLPVLYSHIDPRLDPSLSFVSQIRSTAPVDVAAGTAKLRGLGPETRQAARRYAVEQLSWASIAAETRLFLQQLLGIPA